MPFILGLFPFSWPVSLPQGLFVASLISLLSAFVEGGVLTRWFKQPYLRSSAVCFLTNIVIFFIGLLFIWRWRTQPLLPNPISYVSSLCPHYFLYWVLWGTSFVFGWICKALFLPIVFAPKKGWIKNSLLSSAGAQFLSTTILFLMLAPIAARFLFVEVRAQPSFVGNIQGRIYYFSSRKFEKFLSRYDFPSGKKKKLLSVDGNSFFKLDPPGGDNPNWDLWLTNFPSQNKEEVVAKDFVDGTSRFFALEKTKTFPCHNLSDEPHAWKITQFSPGPIMIENRDVGVSYSLAMITGFMRCRLSDSWWYLGDHQAIFSINREVVMINLLDKTLSVLDQGADPHVTLNPHSQEVKNSSQINLTRVADVIQFRESLIEYIWSGRGIPYKKRPDRYEKGIQDAMYMNLENLASLDTVEILMKNGVNSIVYIFRPTSDNDHLVLYHQGHNGGFDLGKDVITGLLKEGFTVAAFSMPLIGMNTRPSIRLTDGNKTWEELLTHNLFREMESGDFSPIRYFLEPVVVTLNVLLEEQSFKSVSMIGISGGGWTTSLMSALDIRIQRNYPVAGSLPLHMRTVREIGDYEQTLPEVYWISNYLELYVLGAHGKGRREILIYNKYDDVVFDGERGLIVRDLVQPALSKLGGGKFDVYIDDSHKGHKVSNIALKMIIEDIKENDPEVIGRFPIKVF